MSAESEMSGNFDHDAIIQRAREVYDESAAAFTEPNLAVKWGSRQSQYLRFAELIRYVDMNDPVKRTLEIGCGNGELLKFLNFMGYRGGYRGSDINPLLLDQARSRFPGVEFVQEDILKSPAIERYDYVLMSGLFNTNFGQTEQWIEQMVAAMFARTSAVLVFNAISTHVNSRSSDMFYVDPSVLLRFCIGNLSRRVVLAHHNVPYNFTVAVYRHDEWSPL